MRFLAVLLKIQINGGCSICISGIWEKAVFLLSSALWLHSNVLQSFLSFLLPSWLLFIADKNGHSAEKGSAVVNVIWLRLICSDLGDPLGACDILAVALAPSIWLSLAFCWAPILYPLSQAVTQKLRQHGLLFEHRDVFHRSAAMWAGPISFIKP